jgi:integrase
MIHLPNNCKCSELKVNPTNWKTLKASTKSDWYIQYRFYDPQITKNGKIAPKLKIIKGMNICKTRDERKIATEALLSNELTLLISGYNPITGHTTSDTEISPNLYFLDALYKAFDKIHVEKTTEQQIRHILTHFSTGAKKLGYDLLLISEVKRKHIRLILDYLGSIRNKWTNNTFNYFRKYLSILFKELVELEAVEFNPVTSIAKKEITTRLRATLSKDERELVANHLESKYPSFWRFLQVFFHSGARISELLLIKVSDVDLDKQTFKITVKKGRSRKEVLKVIKDIALPFWTESVQNSNPDNYVFSADLIPGKNAIRPDQITKRWYRLVKKQLGIKADFYSLKHLNLDETAELLDIEAAQKMAGHSTPVVTMNHYALGEKERRNNILKGVANKF